jgi:type II secretory pathway pseudopilin PulG
VSTIRTTRSRASGFTLMELLMTIAVIFALMALIIAGARYATRFTKRSADTATLSSLRQGVTQFQQQMGFLPPLVNDFGTGPFNQAPFLAQSGENRFRVWRVSETADLQFLRTSPPADVVDLRFSIYTLPYYILGVCEVPRYVADPARGPVDGVAGPGMLKPRRDGTFERSGQRFDAFFDTSKNVRGLVTTNALEGRVELRDGNGVPYRYYRWEHGKATVGANSNPGPIGAVNITDDLNVPRILGDPDANPALKNAKYAIVGAGPNGLFGNEHQFPVNHPLRMTLEEMAVKLGLPTPATQQEQDRLIQRAMEDNIVELGQ